MEPDIYLIQHKTKSGEWVTLWKIPFDTLEQAEDLCSMLPGIITRIIRIYTTTEVVRKEAIA